MAFKNPIVGGNNELVRDAVRSQGYVTGVSGWAINKNGSAEFSNLTARGSMEVVGTPQRRIKVYVKGGIPVIEFRDDDGDIYEIAGYGGANALAFHAGEELTFITEMALDKDGTWRVDSADSVGPANGVYFDHLSGYFKPRIGINPEVWQAATLANGWTNFGGGYAPLQYRLLPHGFVHIEGTIKPGTTTDGTTVTTLAAGYRPLYVTRRIPLMEKIATNMMADIQTDGQVKVIGTAGTTTVSFCSDFPVIDV